MKRTDVRGAFSPNQNSVAVNPRRDPLVVGTAMGELEVNYQALNDYAVTFLAPWIAEAPERQHSAGDYYQSRLAQGRVLEEYDIAVARYCGKELPRSASYAELGCGFGEVSLMLALNGLRVIGFEAEAARYEGAAALAQAIAAQGISLANLSFVHGYYPETFEPRLLDGRQGVLVATNVTSTYVVEHIDEVTESFRQFERLVIDITRFGLVRDKGAQQELIDRIHSLGFAELGIVYQGGGHDIRHYRHQPLVPSLQPGDKVLSG